MRPLAILLVILALPLHAQNETTEVARALLEEANRAREEGRDDEAIEKYGRVIASAPATTSAYVNLGALYFKQGRIRQAYDTFVAGVERAPDRTLLSNAAATALQLGKAQEALGYVDEALAKNRRDAALYSLRSTTLRALNRNDEALTAIAEAVKLDPREARYQFSAGNLLYQLGKKNEAIAAFRKSIELDRSNLRAYYNLGAVLFESGMYDEALRAYMVALEPIEQAFQRGESVEPIHARAFANLGAIYLTQKKWKEAIAAYEKALRLDPANTTAHYNLGFIYYSMDDFPRAEAEYATALAADPELPLAYLHPALIAYRRGETQRAIDLLKRGMPLFDKESRVIALRTLGAAYIASGRPIDARAAFEEALREKEDAETLVQLAKLEPENRRQLLERALKVEPNRVDVRVDLANILLQQNQIAEARRQLEMVPNPDPRTRMLRALLNPANPNEAIAALASFSDPTSRGNLGLLFWQQGKRDEARPHLQAAHAADPNWNAVTLALGEIAFTSGDYEEAINFLEGSRCTNTSSTYITVGDARAICSRADQSLAIALLASAARKTGRGNEARGLISRAQMLPLSGEHQAIAWFLRGVIDLEAGAEGAARDELTRAIARGLPKAAESAARKNLAAIAEAERQRRIVPAEESEPASSQPKRTIVVYLPDAPAENEKDLAAMMTTFVESVSGEAGVPLEPQMFRRAEDVREYVRANRDRVGILVSPSEIAMDLDLKPRFQFSRAGSRTQRRVVVVPQTSRARNLADLDDASVSIVEGVNPGVAERSFGPVTRVSDDWSAIANVLFGKTEAAVVSEASPLLPQHIGRRLRVVHTTAPLPMPVVAFAPMPESDRDALDRAFRRASVSALSISLARLATDTPPARPPDSRRIDAVSVAAATLGLRLPPAVSPPLRLAVMAP